MAIPKVSKGSIATQCVPASEKPKDFYTKKHCIVIFSVLLLILLFAGQFYGTIAILDENWHSNNLFLYITLLWAIIWFCLALIIFGLYSAICEKLYCMLIYLVLWIVVMIFQIIGCIFSLNPTLGMVFNVFWLALIYSFVLDLKKVQDRKTDEGAVKV